MGCITEILRLKGDKEVLLPEGNWIAVEGGGSYKEHEYLIVLNTNGHRCGYVAIPPEHKYSQTPEEERALMGKHKYKHYAYEDLEIDCHGGLTFMSPTHGLKKLLETPCNDMWIGFDCGHYRDKCDIEAVRKYYGEEAYEARQEFFSVLNHDDIDLGQTLKPYAYVEEECHSIIDQLIKAA